jgi:hypothetical protein
MADAMPVMCSGCAFRPGTEANTDELTQMQAELCLMSGVPFNCHANAVKDEIPKGLERRCRGYLDERQRRGPQPEWRAAVAREGLRLIEQVLAGKDVSPDEATARLLVAGTRAGGLR